MNIVLVYPSKRAPKFGVPLGVASIAAVLRRENHNIFIADLRYESESYLTSLLKTKNPEMVGIYSSTETAPGVLDIGKEVKALLPNTCLVVGGPHATVAHDYFLKDENFDVVIDGEGEIAIVELADAIEKNKPLKKIRGILWKDKSGKIIKNEHGLYVEDLDTLPFPAYDLFPSIKETLKTPSNWMNLLPFTHVYAARGCPFHCTFCQPTLFSTFGKKIRKMSAPKVFELIKYLKDDYKVKEIFFEDDLLLNRSWKSWIYEWTNLVKKDRMDLRWWGQSRANSSTHEMLEFAKKRGCYLVMAGIETGSPEVLKFYDKRITPDNIRNLFSMCKKLDLLTIAEIIFGAPVETYAEAKKTVNLMKEVKPDSISICILTPYPGTHLYEWLKDNNVRFEQNLEKVDRSYQTKRIESPLTLDQIYSLIQETRIAEPSLKYISTRKYYRDAYFKKIQNLIENKEYNKANHLLLATASAPIKKQLVKYYYKNPDSTVLNAFKRLLSHDSVPMQYNETNT